jgi:hypothetical protein
MRGRLVAGSALAVLVLGGLTLANSALRQPLPDLPRHVQSQIMSMAAFGAADDPIWMNVTLSRDFWICPNGSGRIAEHILTSAFPTPAEAAQWRASGEQDYRGVNESFAPGGLFYQTANDVRDGVMDAKLKVAPAGDALKRFGSLLGETAPSPEVVDVAFSIARALDDARVESASGRTSVTGLTQDGAIVVALVFSDSPARLLLETWQAKSRRPGLDLEPPFPIFEREVLVSETQSTGCEEPPPSLSSP